MLPVYENRNENVFYPLMIYKPELTLEPETADPGQRHSDFVGSLWIAHGTHGYVDLRQDS